MCAASVVNGASSAKSAQVPRAMRASETVSPRRSQVWTAAQAASAAMTSVAPSWPARTQRQRGRDAPGRDAAVRAEAQREDEQWRRAEADGPPRGRDEPHGEDQHRGEADRVARRGSERDERKTDEEAERGEGILAERARGVAAETAGCDGQHAARRGRERDEETERRRDRRIAELIGPVLRERAPGRERHREAEERVREGDHGA